MICAEDELGLSDNHDGIMVLDDDAEVGKALVEVLNVEKDKVFEIGLTPNRADAMSHYGVARDLYAKLSFEGKDVTLKTRSTSNFVPEVKQTPVHIDIKEKDKCPRYVGLVIQNVKPVESPDWLKNRLKAIGINPKNFLVDVTNFVMHDLGQPMHAFDLKAIKGNKIIVRHARPGEKIVALDDNEYELTTEDLVIANENEPMAIAGVIGGKYSAINENTTDILLESAYFDPVTVRKTAKRLGISTDSSFRFERGIDPQQTDFAAKWAAILIKDMFPDAIITEMVDETVKNIEPVTISMTYDYIWKMIGEQIPPERIKKILHLLDIKVLLSNEENLTVEVPPFRVDVTRPADVVEELLRIYGYNTVQIPGKMHISVAHEEMPSMEKIENSAANLLVDSGLFETMSVSMLSDENIALSKEYNPDKAVTLLNPLSKEHTVLRQNLLISALENIKYNVNRQRDDLAFFEFGKAYFKDDESRYREEKMLSVYVTGKLTEENWIESRRPEGFFYLKGIVEKLFRRFGIAYEEVPATHPDFSDAVMFKTAKSDMAVIGVLRKDLLKRFDIGKPVYYANIRWEDFLQEAKKSVTAKFKPFSKYPSVRRDLALLVDKDVTYAEIYKIARQTEKRLLEKINLFDVYEGDKIPEGKKSYAVSFVLRAKDKTLNDKQADKIMQRILNALETKTGAKLRHK
jgi:phenylalanyl-tRNA synthetase beta chain